MRILATMIFILFGGAAAHAACDAPAPEPHDGIQFFMGIQPSDDPLDVWCRLQSLTGSYKVDVWFNRKEVDAHRFFPVTFDGTPSHERGELAEFIQSVVPSGPVPFKDENGQNFQLVLNRSTQLQARMSPDGDPLGVPAQYDIARDMVLWEPMALRIEPVNIDGVSFRVTVSFRPSVGRALQAVSGTAEDLILKGWHEYVLRDAGPANERGCPDAIPDCTSLGDQIDLHTAWTVSSVLIEARGKNLSAAALSILSGIEVANKKWITTGQSMAGFDPAWGQASFDADDGARRVRARADGDPDHSGGSQVIRILWDELPKAKTTYHAALDAYADQFRANLVFNAPTQ